MEDNEFEEVTIISHTDQAASILPQQTAERLMKEIRMEVTQKISPTENIKYGTSALTETPTELDQLEAILRDATKDRLFAPNLQFMVPMWNKNMRQYLLGAQSSAFLPNTDNEMKEVGFRAHVYNLLFWGERFFCFPSYKVPQVVNRNIYKMGGKMKFDRHKFGGNHSRHVQTTKKYLYYLSEMSSIIRIDQRLKEVVEISDIDRIQDFFVCPKTETITTLHAACLKFRDKELQIRLDMWVHQTAGNSQFDILKKMYSDHFLVGETNRNDDTHPRKLLLVKQAKKRKLDQPGRTSHVFEVVNTFSFEVRKKLIRHPYNPQQQIERKQGLKIQNIRLLAPRQGINCFLVTLGPSLELFCEYNDKLNFLQTLEVDADPNSSLLVPLWGDSDWMLTAQHNGLVSIKVKRS